MQAFSIQSNKSELILRFDKSQISTDVILKIAQRLQVEYLAQKAEMNEDVLSVADEIDNNWWEKNTADFLKNVKK